MTKLSKEERQKLINSLKEICQEIGCSGIDPHMCQNEPYKCGIIRKICSPQKDI